MSDEAPASPKKRIRWGRILGFILFIGIAGAVAYGLSWLNARTYYLVVGAAEVSVGKGKMLPLGYDPFLPPDPALRKAYKSFPLPGGMRLERGIRKLDDRVELDQAIFHVLEEAAQFSLSKGDARTAELVGIYIDRMRALPGTNAEQRKGVDRIAKQALFIEAKGLYTGAVEALREAAEKFAASKQGDDPKARELAAPFEARIRFALEGLDLDAPLKARPAASPAPEPKAEAVPALVPPVPTSTRANSPD